MIAVGARARHLLQELVLPAALLAVWWQASASSTSLYFPPLSEILSDFAAIWLFTGLRTILLPTLATFAVGYALAMMLGIGLGLVLGTRPALADYLRPLTEFLRALPGVALVPVFMSVLGVGPRLSLTIVVFSSIWPILLNTVDGVRGLDLVARETVGSFRVPAWQRLRYVTLPGASPQIMVGARVSLSVALVAVIVTEMVTPANGVGAFARSAQMSFDLTGMWTTLILMGLVGYLLNLAFVVVEKRVLTWHHHMRAMER